MRFEDYLNESILKKDLDAANARGVGQFHIVKNGKITATHRGFESTCAIAKKQGAQVYNDSGVKVFPGKGDMFSDLADVAKHATKRHNELEALEKEDRKK